MEKVAEAISMKNLPVVIKTAQGEVTVSFKEVKEFICPTATDGEIIFFMQLCKHRQLNPWLKEAYLIKYDQSKPAQIVTAKEAFLNKTQALPNYGGFKAGVVTKKKDKDELIYHDGTIVLPSEILIGGWCEVFEQLTPGAKTSKHRVEVPLEEYNKDQSTWKSMKGTMIRKVAIVHAHREAWAAELSGMITEDELKPATASAAAPVYDVEEGLLSEIMALAEKMEWSQAQLDMNLGTYKGRELELKDMLLKLVAQKEASAETKESEDAEKSPPAETKKENETISAAEESTTGNLPLGETGKEENKEPTQEQRKRLAIESDIKSLKTKIGETDFKEIRKKYAAKIAEITDSDLTKFRDELTKKLTAIEKEK
jgi:phage recombination protein Bet